MSNTSCYGISIRRRFGQNFLHDNSIINAIIAAINPKPNQAMVEIGPGFGALTEPIVRQVGYITVIELDRFLAFRLALHPFLHSRLNIIQQDVMKVNFTRLAKEMKQPLRIFGNIPYNISTSLIFQLFNYIHVIHDMHFMLQKEVANRLASCPNSKVYGRLSVMAQYYCKIIPIMEVPSRSFNPVPKVDSMVVRLVPHHIPPFPVYNLHKLTVLTKIAFSQRRKMLRNSLSSLFSMEQLIKYNIDTTLRAENISVKQYCQLANILAKCTDIKN